MEVPRKFETIINYHVLILGVLSTHKKRKLYVSCFYITIHMTQNGNYVCLTSNRGIKKFLCMYTPWNAIQPLKLKNSDIIIHINGIIMNYIK